MTAAHYRYILLMIGHANYRWNYLQQVIEYHIKEERRKSKGIPEWYEDCLKEVIKMEIECLEKGMTLRQYAAEIRKKAY